MTRAEAKAWLVVAFRALPAEDRENLLAHAHRDPPTPISCGITARFYVHGYKLCPAVLASDWRLPSGLTDETRIGPGQERIAWTERYGIMVDACGESESGRGWTYNEALRTADEELVREAIREACA